MRWHPRCFSLLSFGAPCALLLLLLVVQLQETVTAPSSKGLLQHELLSRQRRANTPEPAPSAPAVGSLNVSAQATPSDLTAGGKGAKTLDGYEDLKFDFPPADLNLEEQEAIARMGDLEKKKKEEKEKKKKERKKAEEEKKRRKEERALKEREAAQEEQKKRREEEEKRTLKELEAAQDEEKKRREEEERTLKEREAAQEEEKKTREEEERTLKDQEAHAKSREPKDTFVKETEGQSSQSDESVQPENSQTAVLPIAAKSVGADFAVNIPSVSQTTSFSTSPAAAAPTASAWSTPTLWTPAPQGSPAPGTTPGVSGPTAPVLGLPRGAASSRHAGSLIPVTAPSTSQANGATFQAQFRSPLASASAPVPREQILSRYLHDVYQFADTKQLLEMIKRGQPLPPQDYQGVRVNYKITGHNVNPVTFPQHGGGVTSWTPTPSAYSALPVAPTPVAVNSGAIPAAPIASIRRPLYYVSFEGKEYPVYANSGDAMAAANQQMQTQRVLYHQQPLVPPTNQDSQMINVVTQLSPNGKTLQPWISSPAVVSIPGTTTVVSNQSPSMQWQKYLMPNLPDGSIPSVSTSTFSVAPATSSVSGVTVKGGLVDLLIPDLSPMPGVPVTVKQLPLGSPTIFPPQSQQQSATPWAQGTPGSPYTVTVYASHNP